MKVSGRGCSDRGRGGYAAKTLTALERDFDGAGGDSLPISALYQLWLPNVGPSIKPVFVRRVYASAVWGAVCIWEKPGACFSLWHMRCFWGRTCWEDFMKNEKRPAEKQRGAFFYDRLSARQEEAEASAVFGVVRHRRSSSRCRTRLAAQKYIYAIPLGLTSSREEKPKEAV